MSTDLRELFEDAGRTPPTQRGWDADDVVTRGRRLRTRRHLLAGTTGVALAGAAAVGAVALLGPGTGPVEPPAASSPTASTSPAPTASAISPSPTATRTAAATLPCTAADVTLTLGQAGGAAGTTYYPVMVKAVPGVSCVLSGVPLVSVPLPSGSPLRASTSGSPTQSVELAGSTVGSFSVGIGTTGNYDPSVCKPVAATSLDIILPADTQASGASTSLALPDGVTVCSGDVSTVGNQVVVTPVVAGPDGA